jgi:hypothetical protein
MAKLPTVVSNLAPDLRAFINRVREAIDGKGGNKLVSVNDLVSSGIAVPGPGGTIAPPAGELVAATPSAPTGVLASGAIQNILVEWDQPAYLGHAYAEVWGSSTNNLGSAVLLGMAPGTIYADSVGPGVSRYYWVRFVNILDTAGPFNAVAGVLGETGSDVEYLLNTLTDAALDPDSPYTKFAVRADLFSVVPEVDFNQESTPTATAVGDLWYQPSTGVTRTWNGSTWASFSVQVPFVVNTSSQTINGVTVPAGVYMDAAFIKNGTITSAKIGNAAIDNAKIVSLNAAKITAGTISADRIAGSSITADKLDVNQLSAVSANTGNLTVTGTFQANTAAVSGTTMTGSGGVLYANGDFAYGNSTTNISFNGTQMTLNGNVVTTNNINFNATVVPASSVIANNSTTFVSVPFTVAGLNAGENVPVHVHVGIVVAGLNAAFIVRIDGNPVATDVSPADDRSYIGASANIGNGSHTASVEITTSIGAVDRRISLLAQVAKR